MSSPRSKNDFYARVFIRLFAPGQTPSEGELVGGLVRVPRDSAVVLTAPDLPRPRHVGIVNRQFIAVFDAAWDPKTIRSARSEEIAWVNVPLPRALPENADWIGDDGTEVWLIDSSEGTEASEEDRRFIAWLRDHGN